MVRCPNTGKELSTDVEMDAATFEQLPHLRGSHQVSRLRGSHQVSRLRCGPLLVNKRGMAWQSTSHASRASMADDQQSQRRERLNSWPGLRSLEWCA
jgi:hypothetical protein